MSLATFLKTEANVILAKAKQNNNGASVLANMIVGLF